jgi:hypothetical protein
MTGESRSNGTDEATNRGEIVASGNHCFLPRRVLGDAAGRCLGDGVVRVRKFCSGVLYGRHKRRVLREAH